MAETKNDSGKEKKVSLLQLFAAFFKIGLTTFGGAMGMLVNLQHELIERHGWITDEELYDYIAIAQCTPGIIMVNTATLLGAKKRGFAGSVISTVAVVLPSLIVITVIASLLTHFASLSAYMAKFLIGVRVSVCATSVKTLINLVKKNIVDIPAFVLFVIVLFCFFYFSLPSALVIVVGIISGITIRYFTRKSEGGGR